MSACIRFFQDKNTHPIPNSSQFAFPTIGASASRKSFTTVASYGDLNGPRGSGEMSIAEEHVVGIDVVDMLSLIAMGTSLSEP